MSTEAVQKFYQRLSEDEAFYAQLQNSSNKAECRAIVQAAGYGFTQTELTDYTAALLEAQSTEGNLNPLAQEELVAVVGGAIALMGNSVVMPPYGNVPFEW
jgi:predicted ribosomally synthesized peptide with nif11-like leader